MQNIKFASNQQKAEIKRNLEFINIETEKIKEYVNLELFSFEQLEEAQIGYLITPDGHSLITDEEDSWDANWIVIGYETMCGDPLIIELNEKGYPVSTLIHGIGSWNGGNFLADSLENFLAIMKEINCFLTEKQVREGNQTIIMKELIALINVIVEHNRFTDFDIWKSLLSPLFMLAEEYEKALESNIAELKKQGKRISEIATQLKIQPKDVYMYMKKISE